MTFSKDMFLIASSMFANYWQKTVKDKYFYSISLVCNIKTLFFIVR